MPGGTRSAGGGAVRTLAACMMKRVLVRLALPGRCSRGPRGRGNGLVLRRVVRPGRAGGGNGRSGPARHVGDDLRRLGAVRGQLDPRRGRRRSGGDRGRGAFERALRADLDLGRAPLPRAPPAAPPRVTTDRGRVLGVGEPRRGPLRQAHPARRRAPPLRLLGERDGGGSSWPATRSATRRISASTAPFPRSSWRCSRRSCGRHARRLRRRREQRSRSC